MAGGIGFTNGHPEAICSIFALDFLVPDGGTGTTYTVDFFDAGNNLLRSISQFLPAQPRNSNGQNAVFRLNLPAPVVFNARGGTINVTVNKSFMWAQPVNTYDACWNVEFFYINIKN